MKEITEVDLVMIDSNGATIIRSIHEYLMENDIDDTVEMEIDTIGFITRMDKQKRKMILSDTNDTYIGICNIKNYVYDDYRLMPLVYNDTKNPSLKFILNNRYVIDIQSTDNIVISLASKEDIIIFDNIYNKVIKLI